MTNETSSPLGDQFDRTVRGLDGVPGVVKTKPTTLRVVHPMLGTASTFIVQTYRRSDGEAPSEDTILVEFMDASGSYRLALPGKVADTIARQRDALTTKNRKRGAAQAVETRAARGIKPNFTKGAHRG